MAFATQRRIPVQAVIYIFASQTPAGLCAFAASPTGEGLPAKFAPWTRTGRVEPGRSPPHGLSRQAIELGVATHGYQLWRRTKPA